MFFGAGLVNGGVLALAPLYAAEHYGPQAAAEFYSAAFIGSLLLQWPAGRISDRVDRRLVIAGLAGLAAVSAAALALWSGRLVAWQSVTLFFLWGAGALSFYGIAVAPGAPFLSRPEAVEHVRVTVGLVADDHEAVAATLAAAVDADRTHAGR